MLPADMCGYTNVPLSILIKCDTAPYHFISGYKDNSLEYSVVKHSAVTHALKNGTSSGKKPPLLTLVVTLGLLVEVAAIQIDSFNKLIC